MIKHLKVSDSGTHHLQDEQPLYESRFSEVLKYHEPGLAPVKDESGAYHIDLSGKPAYGYRYDRTFGFYEGFAAVEREEAAFHILPDGQPAYSEVYSWCGNFQEGLCPVRDKMGNYFHITPLGSSLTPTHHRYVGDFKDGIAVVCNEKGLSTHINNKGNYVHNHWFEQLDVYHKGFARAKDTRGWFHIDKRGNEIYENRFEDLEPFYNGVAHAKDQAGSLLLIDETGRTVRSVYRGTTGEMGSLSNDMIGFWKSFTLYTALQLKILDFLPNSTDKIVRASSLSTSTVQRLLRALWELDIVDQNPIGHWELTNKGKLLTPTDKAPMAFAGQMWIENNLEIWKRLPYILRNPSERIPDYFLDIQKTPSQQVKYYKALEGYALNDYRDLPSTIDWSLHKRVLEVGGGFGSTLFRILSAHPHLKGFLLDLPSVVAQVTVPAETQNRCHLFGINFFDDWEIQVDALVMCRILHDWNDSDALKLLKQATKALTPTGKLYIIEMIIDENKPMGGLLDLNMLVTTGGKERTLPEWTSLLNKSNFSVGKVIPLSNIVSIIEAYLK